MPASAASQPTPAAPTPAARDAERVLVLGGSGFYGRYLVEDLLERGSCDVVVASRHPGDAFAGHPRVRRLTCDLRRLEALAAPPEGCGIVVHCAGPFQDQPLEPLLAAIRWGVDYVDIAEDRRFAREVHALEGEIRDAGITVLSGISVAPAMEALFAELVCPRLDAILGVRTFAAPDTRKHRGPAMFHAMLHGVGREFLQPRDGLDVRVHGWTEPEWVEFPPPLGRRLTYLVLEMADLDELPRLLGARTVEFKAGTEHAFLNWMLGLAARVRIRTGHPRWERFTPAVRALSWLAGRFGKDEGGVVFEITGTKDGELRTHRLAVVATSDGGRIPSVLAAMAVGEILAGRLVAKGLVPINAWIAPERVVDELLLRGLHLWEQGPGESAWRPILDPVRARMPSASGAPGVR